MRLIVGMTGATGAVLGIRLLEHLARMPEVETHLVLSRWARTTIELETGMSVAAVGKLADVVQGVQIVPPMPAFYNHPKSVNDIVDHLVVRILDQFDLPETDAKRWEGMRAAREIHTVA